MCKITCVGLIKTNCQSFMFRRTLNYSAHGSRRYLKEFNGFCLQSLWGQCGERRWQSLLTETQYGMSPALTCWKTNTHCSFKMVNQKLLQTPYLKYKNGTQKKGPMTLTWISIHLKEFSNQLLKLCAKLTHRGAHRHRQMVQPWILQSRNTFKGHDL